MVSISSDLIPRIADYEAIHALMQASQDAYPNSALMSAYSTHFGFFSLVTFIQGGGKWVTSMAREGNVIMSIKLYRIRTVIGFES